MPKALKNFHEVEAFTNAMPSSRRDITEKLLLTAVVISVGGLVYVAVKILS